MIDKTPLEDQLPRLERRIENLETLLQSQTRRIYALEKQTGLEGATSPVPPRIVFSEKETISSPPLASPPTPPPLADLPLHSAPLGTPASSQPAAASESWESKIGGNWLNKIGMVAIVLGVVYFLKYAIDNQWIGEMGRVLLGIVSGVGFLAGGEFLQKCEYRGYGLTLASGGIAILYFSIFAAFNYYSLLPQFPAFLLMALITTTAVLLAARHDSKVVAFIGLMGGFLTPVMLSTGKDNQVALFAYIALLDLGILALACFKNWRVLNLLAFVLTQLVFLGWSSSFYAESKLWPTEAFLTLFFLIFAVLSFLYNIGHKQKTSFRDQFLVLLNGSCYFLWTYNLLEERYFNYLGFYAVLMAVIYVGLASLVRRRSEEDNYLFLLLLGIALTCLTLAIPIQLKQNWITLGWAVEALVLSWIGFKIGNDKTRLGALAILGLVSFRLLAYDSAHWIISSADFTFLANKRGATFLAGVLAILAVAALYAQHRDKLKGAELSLMAGLVIAANLLVLFFFTTEIMQYCQVQSRAAEALVLRQSINSQKQLTISAFWAVYSILLVMVGIVRRYQPVRLLAILLFAVTIAKVFVFDLSELEKIYRIISFIVLGTVLLGASFLYQKYRNQMNDFVLK